MGIKLNRSEKVIITCAVTGNAPFNPRHPAFPVTPKEIAAACVEAAEAGASIAHIHVRDPETTHGSRKPALFKEVVDRVRDSGADILINLTGGLGAFFLPDPENEGRALPAYGARAAGDLDLHQPRARQHELVEIVAVTRGAWPARPWPNSNACNPWPSWRRGCIWRRSSSWPG